MFSQKQSSLLVGKEHVPVGPVEEGVLDAGAFLSAEGAVGTAVFHVTAANRVRRWTAAPGGGGRPAAGLSIFASDLLVTWDVFPRTGQKLVRQKNGSQRDHFHFQSDVPLAGVGGVVAGEVLRAAVHVICAANSIFQRAAAPLARGQLAAGGVFTTLTLAVALHGTEIRLITDVGWKLGVPRDLHFSLDARGRLFITLVVLRTAVAPISTTHRLRQWAAAPLLRGSHEAAGGRLRAAGSRVALNPAFYFFILFIFLLSHLGLAHCSWCCSGKRRRLLLHGK